MEIKIQYAKLLAIVDLTLEVSDTITVKQKIKMLKRSSSSQSYLKVPADSPLCFVELLMYN